MVQLVLQLYVHEFKLFDPFLMDQMGLLVLFLPREHRLHLLDQVVVVLFQVFILTHHGRLQPLYKLFSYVRHARNRWTYAPFIVKVAALRQTNRLLMIGLAAFAESWPDVLLIALGMFGLWMFASLR